MKKISNYKIVSLILLLLILSYSCTKLDETLYSNIKASSYYENQNEILAAVLRPYTHANAWATSTDARSWWKVSELSADQLAWPRKGVDGEDGGIWRRLHYHTWTSNDDISRTPWTLMWDGIGYCNVGIEFIEAKSAAEIGITEEEKASYVAELKIERDFYYIRTMDLYGNIPYVTSTSVKNPETLKSSVVFDSIENDIKANIANMPLLSSSNYGRLTKAGAYAMLVELYLNAEVWSGTPRWQDCINACDSILIGNVGGVTGSSISLDSSVTETFETTNKTSQEQIFSIAYNYQTANWSPGWPDNFYHFNQKIVYGGNRNGNNGIVLIPGVFSTYDNADRRKKEWFWVGQLYGYDAKTNTPNADSTKPLLGYREYANQPIAFVDAIKRFSTLGKNPSSSDSLGLPSNMTTGEENSGVRFNKYRIGASTDVNYNSTDWIIYRLTQIYYAKAEALMRLHGNTPTQEAVDLINACRKRDFDASVWNDKMFTLTNFNMDTLLAERGREFIFEGYRRQDLIRFGKFATGSWWDHTPTNATKELFPIPIEQLGLNPSLVQNPGY
ncbi:RagB/SusD family nutrient uptake outer membrane protein [Rhizosphaericola mali]|uniref:RagB/SusD family nutrient uptake outer membrane protein n=1 Tax=Rhizosphaericola mali TaxID=2545455 RepID=A0A5P2G211_9BACT|nr:RagB/SusD family nutrient uptake outer membrane protein [Rhizosphaericola mali]QES87133.1 RagB/SusD family nutrient uptake outer membrane protein [Rhizosphaericola mali]